MVLEYERDPADILSEAQLTDVALVLVVGQEFPDELYHAIGKQAGNAPIVWLCQDRNNKNIPAASLEKYTCDGTDEWEVLNDVLGRYLKPFHKKS
jgi:hypothetical protein